MNATSQFLMPTIGFLVTVAFGFWLSRVGRPYNGILFNIHKTIALGTVIVTSIEVYKISRNLAMQSRFNLLIILTVLCVAALFASGAFLSIGNLNYRNMKIIHNIAPVMAVAMMGYAIYPLG